MAGYILDPCPQTCQQSVALQVVSSGDVRGFASGSLWEGGRCLSISTSQYLCVLPICGGHGATSQPPPRNYQLLSDHLCWAKSCLGVCIDSAVSGGMRRQNWHLHFGTKSFWSLHEENAQVLLVSMAKPVILSTGRQEDCVCHPLDSQFLKIWGCNSVVKLLPSIYQILGPIPSIVKMLWGY